MRVCLPLDFAPGVEVPLAALVEASRHLAPFESLVICPNGRTARLFPLLEIWAAEEGHEFALWTPDLGSKAESGNALLGVPPILLVMQGAEADFRLIKL